MSTVLIIEDNINDLMWYRPLFSAGLDVSFLFYNKDESYTKEEFIELTETIHEDLFSQLKKKFFCTPENIESFLKDNLFDFYIIDSLKGEAEPIILNLNLPKEKVAILSSTTSFREIMQAHGYKAYKKTEMENLIKECIL